MKKRFILFVVAMVATLTVWAQVPQTLTYQAVVRDGNGRLVCNSNVGVRISILRSSESGVAVYSDQQTVRTNANGLFTLLIGTAENSIGGINWAAGPYYLKSEIDHTGGSNYTLATVQQMFSVPYALRAHTVDSVIGGVNYNETDPVFSAWDKDYNDLINRPTIPTMVSELTNDAGYLTFFTESQILSISNDTIFLTGGSFVKLPDGFSGDYNDLINRPNLADSVSRIVNEYHLGDTIINYISQNGYVDSSYVINYNTQQGYVDTSYVTNYINNMGSVTSETDPVFTAWDKDYNDLINKPNLADSVSRIMNEYHLGDTIINYISQNGYVDSSYVINYNTQQGYVDTSYVTNYISNGGAVTSESDPVFAAWDKDYNDLINKPTIPTVPTNVSEFANDAGYMTAYTETQTLANVAAQGNAVETQIKQLSDPTEELDAVNLRTLNAVVADWSHRFDSLAHRFDSIANSLDSIIAYQDSVIDTLSNILAELEGTTGDTVAVECESFYWYGVNYTESGDYIHRLHASNGLDSLLTMHLTINHGTYTAETQMTTSDFTWHGMTYSISGDYTFSYINSEGCASVDTLHLTIDIGVQGFDEDGASNALFSVSETTQIRFSKGNLQFTTLGTHEVTGGSMETGTWRFAEHQYDYIGSENRNISASYTGWIDLFGWGTSGWQYSPWAYSIQDSDYPYGAIDLTGSYLQADWGVYNAISNGGNQPGLWRTMTYEEWRYLLSTRSASTVCGASNARWTKATVCNNPGLIIFPDSYIQPSGLEVNNVNSTGADFTGNSFSAAQWSLMEASGAIFLPVGGRRNNVTIQNVDTLGQYWSCTHTEATLYNTNANALNLTQSAVNYAGIARHFGCHVRLVKNAN